MPARVFAGGGKVTMASVQVTILKRLAMVMRRTSKPNKADVVDVDVVEVANVVGVVRANNFVGVGIGPAVVVAGTVVAVDATDGKMGVVVVVVGTESAGSVARWVRNNKGAL